MCQIVFLWCSVITKIDEVLNKRFTCFHVRTNKTSVAPISIRGASRIIRDCGSMTLFAPLKFTGTHLEDIEAFNFYWFFSAL